MGRRNAKTCARWIVTCKYLLQKFEIQHNGNFHYVKLQISHCQTVISFLFCYGTFPLGDTILLVHEYIFPPLFYAFLVALHGLVPTGPVAELVAGTLVAQIPHAGIQVAICRLWTIDT